MRLLFLLIFFLFSRSIFSEFTIEFDERDRVTKLNIGKSGYVQYHYDENRLLEITRHTKEGSLLYTHAYEYDSLDHPIKEKLITGKILKHDEGKPGMGGHKEHSHYHRPDPNSKGDQDKYLDEKGNPVPDGHEHSHLYHPNQVWWP